MEAPITYHWQCRFRKFRRLQRFVQKWKMLFSTHFYRILGHPLFSSKDEGSQIHGEHSIYRYYKYYIYKSYIYISYINIPNIPYIYISYVNILDENKILYIYIYYDYSMYKYLDGISPPVRYSYQPAGCFFCRQTLHRRSREASLKVCQNSSDIKLSSTPRVEVRCQVGLGSSASG